MGEEARAGEGGVVAAKAVIPLTVARQYIIDKSDVPNVGTPSASVQIETRRVVVAAASSEKDWGYVSMMWGGERVMKDVPIPLVRLALELYERDRR